MRHYDEGDGEDQSSAWQAVPATMMQMMLTRLKRHAAKHQAIIVPRQRTTIFASKALCNIVYILWNCRE